jgi:tetratricopeptide (TPR) repeat protein
MRGKRLTGGIAAAAAATAVLLGGALSGSPFAGSASEPAPDVAAARLLEGFSPGDTAAYVAQLEARAADEEDGQTLTLLALAYQQRVRETGDPSFYPRAERALRRALQLEDGNALATTGLAALAASRHRFSEARALAERSIRLNPHSAPAYGILGDALSELGRYDEAFAAFERMVALKPGLAAYSRVSYARELLGKPREATAAMRLAVRAGSANVENAAWTLVQLGNLYFDRSRLGRAERAYREALFRLPGYVHAEAALARAESARGKVGRAVELYRSALDKVPLPQYAVGLGDTLQSAGRPAEARKAYALVDVIQRLFEGSGVRTDLESALFDLDHDRDVADALSRAREAFKRAPGINAEDVLAWALYKNGRCREARRHSVAALRLGTRDALKLFHRGQIELCLGKEASGRAFLRRALAINPHFSLLHAPTAMEAL